MENVVNKLGIHLIPKNDEERVNALHRYNILDTPPDGSFNKMTELALAIFDVPIAVITFVDKDRVFYKSGWFDEQGNCNCVDRTDSPCSMAILNNDVSTIEYLGNDPCMMLSKDVSQGNDYEFYVGVPLRTLDGYNIGMFSIVDKKYRQFDEDKIALLRQMAQIVMDELELRYAGRKMVHFQNSLLKITTFDFKAILKRILSLAQLLQTEKKVDIINHIVYLIQESSKNMIRLIELVVDTNALECNQLYLDLNQTDVSALLKGIIKAHENTWKNKNIHLINQIADKISLIADAAKMKEILETLFLHSLKHSFDFGQIVVSLYQKDNKVCFEFRDFGQGYDEESLKNIFIKFTRNVFENYAASEWESGIEMPLVKNLVELHGGTIEAESIGINQGSCIKVKFPVTELN